MWSAKVVESSTYVARYSRCERDMIVFRDTEVSPLCHLLHGTICFKVVSKKDRCQRKIATIATRRRAFQSSSARRDTRQ